MRTPLLMVIVPLLLAVGCSENKSCTLGDASTCGMGQVCESVVGQTEPKCFAPVEIRGRVFNLANGAAIAQAIVQGVDANGASMGAASRSGVDGAYALTLPVPRNPDGSPADWKFTLRATAADFLPFPSGIRIATPIDARTATGGTPFVLMSQQTDIGLVETGAPGLGSIAGTVRLSGAASALVVAEGPQTVTALSDRSGAFVLFNVAAGTYTVRAYRAGGNIDPVMVTVAVGENRQGVDLQPSTQAPGTVSGSVNIVNGGGSSVTSVVLVVASTFNDVLKRGEVPPGLRAPAEGPPNVSNAFTISGVPDGTYKVLAAFENDGLVRDPDTSIGGTVIQEVTLPSAGSRTVSLPASFKVTGALAVVSPGADQPTVTNATPTFVFEDDSSEDGYHLEVFDVFGVLISNWDAPKVSGSANVSVPYQGPALTPQTYQFRATSFRDAGGGGRTNISQTEDLRGVFIVQ